MTVSILWFRRDLRLADHPALAAAAESGTVLPVFVLDPQLIVPGRPRTTRLLASLQALDESLDGRLLVRSGEPVEVVADIAAEVGAELVHVTGETTPYGRRRDAAVAVALGSDGRRLVATGTPYAVSPGRVRTQSGTPFRVFTPFSRAWRQHGAPQPATWPRDVRWFNGDVAGAGEPWAAAGLDVGSDVADAVVAAGEAAAGRRWLDFLADERMRHYDADRDRPDLDGTTRLSTALKYGEIHPRTLLRDIATHPDGDSPGAQRLVSELAWREFYADVLWHNPRSAWHDLRPELAGMAYDEGPETDQLIEAWRRGRTGYPIVDAGMRQLLAEGWMHNRIRMITASFLTKDLHVWWPVGARHFLDHLMDGDIASNSHGWQWVAGTGTDAAPYFRVLNPVRQAHRFDPTGDYVRRWVPELRGLDGAAVHEPWRHPNGYDGGYPKRIVDHDAERREALARYQLARAH